jgi:hypothetical protein
MRKDAHPTVCECFFEDIMETSNALSPGTSALGVSFDGRAYHYRRHTYDRLEDALGYARLDAERPGGPEEAVSCHWQRWDGPTAQDRLRMATHCIAYERGHYYYGPYRYDLLDAALTYAARAPGLKLDHQVEQVHGT